MSLGSLFLAFAAIGSVEPNALSSGAEDVTRNFLNALMVRPADARHMIDEKSVIIVGDIGGSLQKALEASADTFTQMSVCRIGDLRQKPLDPSVSLREFGIDANANHANISAVEGTLVCPSKDAPGSVRVNRVSFVLRNHKVAVFSLQGQR